MSDNQANDELHLLDYVTGNCSEERREDIRQRLEAEPQLRKKFEDLQAAHQAVGLTPELNPPEDLTTRTMARIRSAQKTDALLAREELNRRGFARPTFSLREGIAAAAAVILLAVVFLPSMQSATRREMQTLCASQVGRIGHAIWNYALENDNRMPAPNKDVSRWLPNGSEPYTSNSSGLFQLIRHQYAAPSTFQCPAMSTEAFQYREGMDDFPAGRYIHYSYQHAVGPSTPSFDHPDLRQAAGEMVILADDTPLFENGRFRPDRLHALGSGNHQGRGQNVLYIPGNVRWVERPDVGVDGNNIYQANDVYEYRGTEAPGAPYDSFLLPAYIDR
jgi:type II secretory pathway pseudopilin PulG